MKIKGKLIIPLVAILIAMFTLGITPGVAADTTGSSVSTTDPLTYVPPTAPATSSLEEEIEGMVSDMFGEDLKESGDTLRGFSQMMAEILNTFRNLINKIIEIFQSAGGMLGNIGSLDEGLLGGDML